MFIGLDLGTSGLKALLVDDAQNVIATETQRYPIDCPAPGLAEQDPAHWLRAVRTAMAALRAQQPSAYAAVRCIGLSGQMHSLVVLDKAHIPLRPAILWNDTRGDSWCSEVSDTAPWIQNITGVAPMPSFTSAKLAWLRAAEPEIFDQIAHVVLPKDFVRLTLTGTLCTDPSDASGTQLLDQASRRWSSKMIDLLGASSDWFPDILDGPEVSGNLTAEIADEFGLDRVPVISGAGDAAASAIGMGCLADGAAMISLGTGALYLSAQGAYHAPQSESVHAFSHCVPDTWFSMTTLLACGSVLDWGAALFGGGALLEEVERLAQTDPGPGRVMFLPYIDGTRTPLRDAHVRGAFLGVDGQTGGDAMLRAVIEGVGFALADAQAELRQSASVEPSPIVVGGGATSRTWCRMIATILQRPVRRSITADGGAALGAARLAMLGAQAGSPSEICFTPQTETVEPDAAQIENYASRFEVFRKMFPAARDFARIG